MVLTIHLFLQQIQQQIYRPNAMYVDTVCCLRHIDQIQSTLIQGNVDAQPFHLNIHSTVEIREKVNKGHDLVKRKEKVTHEELPTDAENKTTNIGGQTVRHYTSNIKDKKGPEQVPESRRLERMRRPVDRLSN